MIGIKANMYDKNVKKQEELEAIYKVFDSIIHFTMAECGDGSSIIVCEDYKKLADLFEEYSKSKKTNYFPERIDRQKIIIFVEDEESQESISFSDNEELLSHPFYEFVVKLDLKYQ